ncbi:MAG: RNA polymerase factor sigma-54 [Gammaproteobacteria bacterium]|nr:RNA polymerase factor sigma-54 [Gammaproteobacteria bacterium]
MLKLKPALTQKLSFSTKLQQSVRLLQYSAIELNQATQEILEQNPFLEIETQSIKIEKNTTELTKIDSRQASTESKDILQKIYSADEDLYTHLKWQLDTGDFSTREYQIADFILDAIDVNGYFYTELKAFKATITLHPKPRSAEIIKVLKKIQTFDPDGVAAQSVQACLLLQLRTFSNTHPYKKLAIDIIKNEYEALYSKSFRLIISRLHIDKQRLDGALKTIQSLNPYPGAPFDNTKPNYIIPDLTVEKYPEHWQVSLYQDLYKNIKLKHNNGELLQKVFTSKEKTFIKTAYNEAKWFKQCIDNRNSVLLKVAQIIIDQQVDFLDKGKAHMHPLNLNAIAELSELHISTISRAVSQKYIQTPHGIYKLKYFFRTNLSNQENQNISSVNIKPMIKKIISQEDPFKPYSDEQIVATLSLKKINISRRTVAKYRLSLNLDSSSKRKLKKTEPLY